MFFASQVFKRLGLRATFYTDEEMLARYPMQAVSRIRDERDKQADIPKHATCPLCLKTDKDVTFTRTRCCRKVRTVN